MLIISQMAMMNLFRLYASNSIAVPGWWAYFSSACTSFLLKTLNKPEKNTLFQFISIFLYKF